MATGRVAGTFTQAGQSPAFLPDARPGAPRQFNLSIWGTFTGSVQLERSFDRGASWIACSRDAAGVTAAYGAPASLVVEEPEAGVLYRLNCLTLTSGAADYRMSQ